MQITLTPELKQHPEWSALVERANETLQAVVRLESPTTASWSVQKDERNGSYLLLRLRDSFADRGSARFEPTELRFGTRLETRLLDLKAAMIRIGEWRSRVNHLYERIRDWAKEIPGGVTISEDTITVSEFHSGDYEMPRLLLRGARTTLRVEPIAAWTLSGNGRVDLMGIGGPYTMHYHQSVDLWMVEMGTFPPKREVLTKELFLYLAEAWFS